MRKGQVWQFERDRPSQEDDPRTLYRVVVSADYRLPPERRWVLTAPIVSTLDVETLVAVRLQPADPVKGFIRADEVTRTYVPWLSGPVGMITVATLDALTVALRTEMDLSRRLSRNVAVTDSLARRVSGWYRCGTRLVPWLSFTCATCPRKSTCGCGSGLKRRVGRCPPKLSRFCALRCRACSPEPDAARRSTGCARSANERISVRMPVPPRN